MRYDGILERHHHLYCSESDRIEDYNDKELDDLLNEYFKRKKIKDFKVEDIKLQIKGKFKQKK
jgi:Fur family peroxide stress response transcriptional regulator